MRKREEYKGYTIIDHEGEIFWIRGFTNVATGSFERARQEIDKML